MKNKELDRSIREAGLTFTGEEVANAIEECAGQLGEECQEIGMSYDDVLMVGGTIAHFGGLLSSKLGLVTPDPTLNLAKALELALRRSKRTT